MHFTMTVDMNNAAFEDNPNELHDLLFDVAHEVDLDVAGKAVVDSNGTKVGTWEIVEN